MKVEKNIAIDTEQTEIEGNDGFQAISKAELMKRKFLRNRLAVLGGIVIILFYMVTVIFPGFFSTYDYNLKNENFVYAPPQIPRFIDSEGKFHLRPFVYGLTTELNEETFTWVYKLDKEKIQDIYFFNRGYEYRIFGLIRTNIHFLGVKNPESNPFYLFGSDRLGRDVFSRIIYGGRVSLTVGLVGVILTIILGSFLGTISGYFGGIIDNIIQRSIELILSFPDIPLWAALSAALPHNWDPVKTFFAISVILSLRNWAGLGRQIRGKVLSYKEEEYALAAKATGASDLYIIARHMIPNTLSHIIVIATLSIPGMILAETALSFLGLGIRPPMTSWGVLLQASQQISVVLQHPWLLAPGLFVIIAVLSFNFLGDGVRDAADPFSS